MTTKSYRKFLMVCKNAVKNLNIEPYEPFSIESHLLNENSIDDDAICRAIRKYKNHPCILKIKEVDSEERSNTSIFNPQI